MRGLKQNESGKTATISLVASFTDAWIETTGTHTYAYSKTVASFTDAWIETEFKR